MGITREEEVFEDRWSIPSLELITRNYNQSVGDYHTNN